MLRRLIEWLCNLLLTEDEERMQQKWLKLGKWCSCECLYVNPEMHGLTCTTNNPCPTCPLHGLYK